MGLSGRNLDFCRYSAYGGGDSVPVKMDKEKNDRNDGAPIHAGAVKPELEGDMVIITISGSEMDDLIFRVFID